MHLSTLLTPSHPVLTKQLGWQSTFLMQCLLCVGFSILTAGLAQLAIPLPWTPVPITGQTLAVLLSGIVLGPRLASISLLLYLLEGGIGLPVFAGGGSGWAWLSGASGGYLVSFPLAASLVGWLALRGWDRKPLLMAMAMIAGSLVIYSGGLMWLGYWLFLGGKLASGWSGFIQTIKLGMLPFLIGDAIKIALTMAVLPTVWHFIPTHRSQK